jgi:hypothetical protein
MIELIIIIAAIVGGYQLVKTLRRAREQAQTRRLFHRQQVQAAAVAQLRQAQTDATRRTAAREMQSAILQLHESQDFRRAATFAERAAQVGVPAAFRQRQFRRLRPLLIQFLSRRLEAGAAADAAAEGLRNLVTALGVAAYEADYIINEARGPQAAPRRAPDYRERLGQLHSEHARRLDAIRSTPSLDPALAEQLLEAEQERFRREVLDNPDEGI